MEIKALAEQRIGVFAISTFNTDYILVKQENFAKVLHSLEQHGYKVLHEEVCEKEEKAAPKEGLPAANALFLQLQRQFATFFP